MKKNGNLTRGERLQIMMSPEELAVVDDFSSECQVVPLLCVNSLSSASPLRHGLLL